MWSTLWEYRYIIIAAIIAVYYLVEWQRSKTILYALMLQAKKMAKDLILKTGKEEEDWVIKKAMIFLPATVKIFLNENIVRAIVHELYHALKSYSDDVKTDNFGGGL